MASIYKRKGDDKYTVAYYPRPRVRRTVRGCADRKATEALARKLETEAMLRRKGIIDTKADQYAAANAGPLMERDAEDNVTGGHLADFHAAMLARGVTDKQAFEVRGKVARVLDLCEAGRISELSPSAVQGAIAGLRESSEEQTGLSLQTCNHYLKAAKQFSRWLRKDGRCRDDALAHLSGYNVALDRRHDRRALTDDELARLIDAAEAGPVVRGMAGADRAMLYRLAVHTGFRANELRSLTPESFDLNATPPTVTVCAGYSKRRHADLQPLRADLAAMLRDYLTDRPEGAAVFAMPDKPGKMLRADLEAGRSAWLDEAPTPKERKAREKGSVLAYRNGARRVVDFHALRHTFITNVVKSGASVKVCQELARHSDPKLTLGVYTHLTVNDRAAALDALPGVTPQTPRRESAKATGTYDARPESGEPLAAHSAARRGHKTPQVVSTRHDDRLDSEGDGGIQSPLSDRTWQRSSRPDNTQTPVAQLDRASVFGTEAPSSQTAIPKEDTTPATAARSAYDSAQPSKPPISRPELPPDLSKIIDAWPTLPEAVKAGIRAMVGAARKVEGDE